MKRLWISLGLTFAAGLVLAYAVGRASANGVPQTNALTYKGSLYTFGQPDNSTHSMTLELYVSGSSTPSCTTGAAPVTTVNGQFSVTLPAACVTVIHQNAAVEVDLVVDGTDLGQAPVTAVPYALEADTASNVAPGSNLAAAFVPQSAASGAASLPSGTTAQRPSSPTNGMVRMNTTTGCIEAAYNNSWTNMTCLNQYTASVLVVAGGGGGGSAEVSWSGGGGGGAGGLLTSTLTMVPGTQYTGVIGSGGGGGNPSVSAGLGNDGFNSSFDGLVSIGGGGGGGSASTANANALSGGSGGGGGNYGGTTNGQPGSGTTGQGYSGGSGTATAPDYGDGGGGGAGGTGGNGTTTNGGNGGQGLAFNGVIYAGGGGGGTYSAGPPGAGGTGGGGAGGEGSTAGASGQANTGGGGGGSGATSGAAAPNGGNGGTGVVLVTYPGTQRGTGGTVTYNSSSNTTTHTFTTAGSFTYGG